MNKDLFYYTGLLAEIRAAGLTDEQYRQICVSMSTTRARIDECLCHAEFFSESTKGNIEKGIDIDQWKEEDAGRLDKEGYCRKRFGVFEDGKPADHYNTDADIDPRWENSQFDSLILAQQYARKWLGEHGPIYLLSLNEEYIFDGNVTLTIKEIK